MVEIVEVDQGENRMRDLRDMALVMLSRPGTGHQDWKPPATSFWTLAKDEQGVCAFFASHRDEGGFVIDQMEGIWEDGQPSIRGRRGLAALLDRIHQVADSEGVAVYAVVQSRTERAIAVLQRRGYVAVPVVILKRPAPMMRTDGRRLDLPDTPEFREARGG